LKNHFRALFEEQGVKIVANAPHRLTVELREVAVSRPVDRKTLEMLRPNTSLPMFGPNTKWLNARLEKEGEIPARRLTCRLAVTDHQGRTLVSAARSFETEPYASGYVDHA
jgi:hypothetical protein